MVDLEVVRAFLELWGVVVLVLGTLEVDFAFNSVIILEGNDVVVAFNTPAN
jgi:hypothetical protein